MDQELSAFVANRFAEVHSASPQLDYARWCRVDDGQSRPAATLGYRLASEGALFLEAYLPGPIESIVSANFGRPIARNAIVEIGCLAATPTPALLKLWREVAGALRGSHEIAVATVTRPLRMMFSRIGLPLIELAPADPAMLPDASGWGSYYELDPVVCAGSIAIGASALADYRARGARP